MALHHSRHKLSLPDRIASRLAGDVTDFHAANEVGEYGVQAKLLDGRQKNDIKAAFDQLKLSHPAIWNVPGMVPPCNQGEEEDELCACVFQHQCGDGPIYFFHSDHLGSSTFLTDGSGQSYQFFLNLPFGDVRSHPDIYRPGTMEEQFALSPNAWWKTPYLFNGKELDSRTSLYYYGARYYDPGLSVWLSVDPLAEKYAAWTPYNYTYQNPIRFIDPTGMEGEKADWKPELDENNNVIYISQEGDSYKTFVDQYGRNAAEEVFSSNCGCYDESATYSEGDMTLTGISYPLIIRNRGNSFVDMMAGGFEKADNDIQDVYNQLVFAESVSRSKGSNIVDINDYFVDEQGRRGPAISVRGSLATIEYGNYKDAYLEYSNIMKGYNKLYVGLHESMNNPNILIYSTAGHDKARIPYTPLSIRIGGR